MLPCHDMSYYLILLLPEASASGILKGGTGASKPKRKAKAKAKSQGK